MSGDGDKHKPLRDDVRLLGELLGETLDAHGGPHLLETVEQVRAVAKAVRAGTEDLSQLAHVLLALPVEMAIPLARAFAHFLNLANVAEQHHRIRRRRAYLSDATSPPQRGSCDETFRRLVAGRVSPDDLFRAVMDLRVELVLTAHPTEVQRRTLIHKYNRVAALLGRHDRTDLTLPERNEVVAALRREIASAWETDEVRQRRPSPLDEVRSGLVVFEQSLWEALPRYLRGVDRALAAVTGKTLPLDAAPVRFGSWIGGDRDGNPHVTADVTRKACLLSRWVAADLYIREVDALRDELSMARASPALLALVSDTEEPYRALLRQVRARLVATREWVEASLDSGGEVAPGTGVCLESEALAAPLRLVHESLVATGNDVIAAGRLTDLLRRIAAFGVVLARLDIRQEAGRHTETLDAVTQAIGIGSYAEWDEPQRIEFLLRELNSRRPLVPEPLEASSEVLEALETFRTLARIPRESLGAYVITMTRQASDVLAVELLQKAAGIAQPLRVVPLFETVADLRRAPEVVDRLLSIDWYRRRIDGRQEVMVGYSDSAKDVGRFSAGWELYKAQEAIGSVCRRHAVPLTLFHGRGGSVGRGGGPTYMALQSQPPGSVAGALRVTEQGEMIQALFGLPDIAVRTMEVYTSGTLDAWLRPSAPARPEWREAMERFAADAARAYRRYAHEHPQFMDYFRAATPLTELEGLNIGSRPSRRGAAGALESLRAIPWQFAWTQTRLLLPSWLGIEEALDRAFERGDGALLCAMYEQWPHVKSALDLAAMVLAKTDAGIAAEYDRQLVPPALQPLGGELRQRLERAVQATLRITGHRVLVEENQVLRRSIDVRNPYVDPINLVQIELIRRLRRGDGDPRLSHALMITVNGIAAGLRNTG